MRCWRAVAAGQAVLVVAGVVTLAGLRGRVGLPGQGVGAEPDPVPAITLVAVGILLGGLPVVVARVAHPTGALRRGAGAVVCAAVAAGGGLVVFGGDLLPPFVLGLGVAVAVALPGRARSSTVARGLVVVALTLASATLGIGGLIPILVLPAVAAGDHLARRGWTAGRGGSAPMR